MSEIMRPIPFPDLVRWVQGEYKNHNSVFGIRKEKFFRPSGGGEKGGPVGIKLFGTRISTPIGPAAGPHSQLAQNILVSFLAGARFIELKTVQTMDGAELRKAVARPCINAEDEGYNVEWSTELTVKEAQEEYIKAWFLCHVFSKEFAIAENCDFIFNMSAGYSLDGIKSQKIDSYMDGLKNAGNTAVWKSCHEYLLAVINSFERFKKSDLDAVSPVVSDSITLSTLHGCPREEIEKIASYLVTEKRLNTFIKCNPTLLGYERARSLLDGMGYNYVSFDDHHFKNDLQFCDAVEMLGRLKSLSTEHKLRFGVKLTNTFPVQIKKKELPGEEMYMSGRSLFPLSINVAKMLTGAFNGELPISYSGGADFFNLKDILETGIMPVTAATTILKPGGYERLNQLAELAEKTLEGKKCPDKASSGDSAAGSPAGINLDALNVLAESLPQKKRYRKEHRQTGSRKPPAPCSSLADHRSLLPMFDCFKAPCIDNGCPIHQNIPDYLAAVAAGNYGEAIRLIAKDNTAPSITGTICDHQCQYMCTRIDYEDSLQIRQAKIMAADRAQEIFTASLAVPAVKTEKSAAVIGAGPAGIAAAVFLRRNGVPVTVYEKRSRPFGIVQYVIPSFRISDEAIYRDFQMAEKYGVEFVFDYPVSSIPELQKKHDFIVIATGAWKEGVSPVKQGQENVIDALSFLEDSKKSKCSLNLGKNVAVIGAGDVAMDCARAAKHNNGVESVTVVYRRTREFMPSQYEDQELALADGVRFMELLAPESFEGGVLTCEVMRLGDFDKSGRRNIEGTGEKLDLPFDTVIGAVGARVDTDLFIQNNIALDRGGLPAIGLFGETSVPGVYLAGDCRNGAATVVKAIADGKAVASDILKKLALESDFSLEPAGPANNAVSAESFSDLYFRKGVIAEACNDNSGSYMETDAYRCLTCNVLCEICVDVCPNRANVMVEVQGKHQVIHIDRMCNECGNCSIFCPHPGKPYKDKFTVFSNEEDFSDSENPGFLKTNEKIYKLRLENKSIVSYRCGDKNIPDSWIKMIDTIESRYGYLLILGS